MLGKIGAQIDRLPLGVGPDEPQRLLRDRHHVHRLAGRVEPSLDLADVEKVGHEIGHMLGCVADVVAVLLGSDRRAGYAHRVRESAMTVIGL